MLLINTKNKTSKHQYLCKCHQYRHFGNNDYESSIVAVWVLSVQIQYIILYKYVQGVHKENDYDI